MDEHFERVLSADGFAVPNKRMRVEPEDATRKPHFEASEPSTAAVAASSDPSELGDEISKEEIERLLAEADKKEVKQWHWQHVNGAVQCHWL